MSHPKHIAIIPDGNRTRAQKHQKDSIQGHLEGVSRGLELINYTIRHTDVQVITWRWLSTENSKKRTEQERAYLFWLYKQFYNAIDILLTETQTNFHWIGNPQDLPEDFVSFLQQKKTDHTYGPDHKTVCLAFNYGGQDEIIRAIHKASLDGIDMQTITASDLTQYTDLGHLPPLDFVIRTKADEAQRISWFALWSIGYAELYFSPSMFPDFDTTQLQDALQRYADRQDKRNFGA